MPHDPNIHRRRSLRLVDYDYSQAGAYFVTICTQGNVCLFGTIEGEEARLNSPGRMVQSAWAALPGRFPSMDINDFVVMPNHFHGIVVFTGERAGMKPAPTLGRIIGAFKSITTHEYIQGVQHFGWSEFDGRLWQRNYYEHIIRTEASLQEIRAYIATNPQRWALDKLNPASRS